MADDQAYLGPQDPTSASTDESVDAFAATQLINRISTATLVKIMKVAPDTPGAVKAIGRVDVQPLVNQIDGYGKATPHGTVHSLNYFRFAGGKNAVLLDPQEGDVGIMISCDRDTSSVKATGARANPGSRRRFDMADGVFFGIALGQSQVEQYVAFTKDGIKLADKNTNTIVMGSTGVLINGCLIDKNGDVITKHGTSLDHHVNTLVTSGSDESGPPP